MAVYALGDVSPQIHHEAYVHPDATVIGDVRIGAGSTVWPGAVLRGDYGTITVGERTSIQDGTVIHCTPDKPTTVGSDCVVGHLAHLEGCTIEDHCLVGSGSVVLHDAIVRSGALVAAGAVVGNRVEVPAYAMAKGVPATMKLDAVTEGAFALAVDAYVWNGQRYRTDLKRLDRPADVSRQAEGPGPPDRGLRVRPSS